MPLAVVVDELFDVSLFVQAPEKEVVQDGIVEYDNSRLFDRAPVDRAMKLVVAHVVEVNVRAVRARLDLAVFAKRAKQRGGIVGHARTGRRQRRVEAYRHALLREPNSAVPTRKWVAPSSMAISRSCDMPIDSLPSPSCSASPRSRMK